MIIFISSSACSISQHLRFSTSKGIIGFYDSKDERAVFQAAALAGKKVFILNVWLVWLSLVSLLVATILIIDNQFFNVAQSIFWMGVLLGFAVISLESISLKHLLRK